jgi:hypothetical protein
VAAALLLPAMLAGCGGGGAPGAEKARYIVQSDAICGEVFAQAAAAGTAHDKATADKLADVWGRGSDRLKAMEPPSESVELARQFVTDVENIGLSYVAASRALELNDQAKAERDFNDVSMIKSRAAKTAKDYGYKVCRQING